jgi:hypothetical protein
MQKAFSPEATAVSDLFKPLDCISIISQQKEGSATCQDKNNASVDINWQASNPSDSGGDRSSETDTGDDDSSFAAPEQQPVELFNSDGVNIPFIHSLICCDLEC